MDGLRTRKPEKSVLAVLCIAVLLAGLVACDTAGPSDDIGSVDSGPPGNIVVDDGSEDDDGESDSGESTECTISLDQIFDGGVGGRDGIPALTDPPMTTAGEAVYLSDTNRVVGIVARGVAMAIPHNVLWWHEIVNLNKLVEPLAVTYCPLTGSSIVFRRSAIGGAELGVSGLLYRNNLIMYDRSSDDSLWPQMNREAACGPRTLMALPSYPAADMTWGGWKALHPDTRVVAEETGFERPYTVYPYGNYEQPNNADLIFPQSNIDTRRPPKERVLGIPGSEKGSGMAFPFGQLDKAPLAVASAIVEEEVFVVFWDQAKETALAFHAMVDGQEIRFAVRDGKIKDLGTGSVWRVDGLAEEGPLAGTQLTPKAEAYVSFWFAWAAFHPNTGLWTGT